MPSRASSKQAHPLLKVAYDCGLNTWDAANALETYSIPRKYGVVTTTKCFWASHWPTATPSNKPHNARIVLLQIHRLDSITSLEETMSTLHELVVLGKVCHIGASSMLATQFAQLQFTAEKKNWTRFISIRNQYSLIYYENEREGSGRTSKQWFRRDEADLAIIRRIMQGAEGKRWPMAHVALVFTEEEEEEFKALHWSKAYLVAESL
ncbi:NADP-dependent oxidoreductase domain-containing protein [Aspergillus pseudoustus]|uniref:NADP-dependent oxidoreductase domain-containing protein n=1 Tax=Aspergillus pseudoustus TaxID=1810923 RepID=A0ABR4II56_9EURO